MLSFMFGVLGTMIFWCGYFIVSFFVGSILLKHLSPKTFAYVTIGDKSWEGEDISWFFIFIGIYIFWPIWLIYKIIHIIMTWFLLPLIRKSIITASSIMPDIEIKKRKET